MRGLELVLALFVVTVLCGGSRGHADQVLEEYSYTTDFESGSVGAWSSYPPSQDTAYDPSIWVKPLKAVASDNRSLYREITPNYNIDYTFGVRKKVDMFVDSGSVLSFKAYIKSNRDIGGVRVKFGFADGESVERDIEFSARESWRDCSIKLADMVGDEYRELEAVAFMAICPNADPENLLRFGLDHVSLNGYREMKWDFVTPQSHVLDEWEDSIAGTHFQEGGKLTITAQPPINVGSAALSISRALTGSDERHFRMRKNKSSGAWSASINIGEKSGVTAGIWRATIQASSQDKKDDTVSSSLVFLVKKADAPADNPRILMAGDDIGNIREKIASGRMKEVFESIEKRAEGYRQRYDYKEFNYNLDAYDEVHWLPTYGGYINAISQPASYIRANGVVYGVSGDSEAGEAARLGLLKMAEWPSYVHPHILNQGQYTYWPVGQKLLDMAVGFDMAADRFNGEERKKVAEALYSKGVTEVFKEYVRDNRVSSFTSNWIGDVTAGGISCAMAVMNDYPAEDLEPYLTGMILKMNALIENGFGLDSYGEGYSYLNHAMHCMNVGMPALERTFGIQFPEKTFSALDIVLYQYDRETKKIYDWGDTSTGVSTLSNFTYMIAKSQNPYYRWLYDRTLGHYDVDLFLMDESVPATDPENLPHVKLFDEVGTVAFRSGFEHDDFAFIFRCGPFYNHQHFDQGSFYFVDKGEVFLNELGKSDYYNDPWYKKLVIQAGGHNCVLVDKNAESQLAGDLLNDVKAWDDYASISDFLAFDGGGFASGRLDAIYKGKLDYLRRSALYIAPRTVVLIDETVGAGEAKTVDLRFHTKHREDIAIDGSTASIAKDSGTLTIKTVAPAEFVSADHKRPLTTSEFDAKKAVTMKARGYLELSGDISGAGTGLTFVNVLSTDGSVISDLDEKREDGHVALSLAGNDYYINTSAGNPVGATFKAGDITSDALVYGRNAAGYVAMRVSTLSDADGEMLSADNPLTLAFKGGGVMTLSYSAESDTKMTFRLSSKPKLVSLNGEKYRGWSFSRKTGLSIDLPQGSGEIAIR